jgi:hypothetical protein
MARVIAIAHSRGAGKTSLTVHLACALGRRRMDEPGIRKGVGLVDLDPLMSLTKWFALCEHRIGPEARLCISTAVGWRAQGETDRAQSRAAAGPGGRCAGRGNDAGGHA